jgi:malate permease and related proteins
VLDLDALTAKVLILFGALPPAVMNYLIAERYAAYPAEVATIVSFGNIAALGVIPGVLLFLL